MRIVVSKGFVSQECNVRHLHPPCLPSQHCVHCHSVPTQPPPPSLPHRQELSITLFALFCCLQAHVAHPDINHSLKWILPSTALACESLRYCACPKPQRSLPASPQLPSGSLKLCLAITLPRSASAGDGRTLKLACGSSLLLLHSAQYGGVRTSGSPCYVDVLARMAAACNYQPTCAVLVCSSSMAPSSPGCERRGSMLVLTLPWQDRLAVIKLACPFHCCRGCAAYDWRLCVCVSQRPLCWRVQDSVYHVHVSAPDLKPGYRSEERVEEGM